MKNTISFRGNLKNNNPIKTIYIKIFIIFKYYIKKIKYKKLII